jgi:hypothetical protein
VEEISVDSVYSSFSSADSVPSVVCFSVVISDVDADSLTDDVSVRNSVDEKVKSEEKECSSIVVDTISVSVAGDSSIVSYSSVIVGDNWVALDNGSADVMYSVVPSNGAMDAVADFPDVINVDVSTTVDDSSLVESNPEVVDISRVDEKSISLVDALAVSSGPTDE